MFKVSKIGLLNFWNYDEEEYEFYDGKLLLRGSNGSGKSVTMQSFIPLILDGNKSPKRLDTFGGTAKHMDYYLLGDDKDESTGYLYMEFYNKEDDKYLTIGMGLNAKKGKNIDFWGFALLDGTRINNDFQLYKVKDGFNKTPLTKIELKTKLNGSSNRFVDTQKDYKAMVNEILFGFSNIVSYDELINIILQIRSPKLSKEFKPIDLMNTLNDVLPPLSDEDLKPISETIESLNSTKEKLNSLSNKISELNNFVKVFNNYNETILYNKAKKYLNKLDNHNELVRNKEELVKSFEEKENRKLELEKRIEELNISYKKACIEKEQIDNSDIKLKKEREVKLASEISSLEKSINLDSDSLIRVDSKRKELLNSIDILKNDLLEINNKLTNEVGNIEHLCSRIFFDELSKYLSLIVSGEFEDYDFIKNLVSDYSKEIERIRNILKEKNDLISKVNDLEIEFDLINSRYEELLAKYDSLLSLKEQTKDDFISEFISSNNKHRELKLNDDEVKSFIDLIKDFNLETYLVVKDKYVSVSRIVYNSILEEKSSLNNRLSVLNEELRNEKNFLEELKNKKELELEESFLEKDVCSVLNDRNVNYISFYKAIDFKDNFDKDIIDRLEANLLSSGLLSSKIISESDVSKVQDINITYVLPGDKKKDNLTKYLVVSEELENFSKDYVLSILESISVSDDSQIFVNSNSYSFDVLKGKNNVYESKYIGFLNRKREQEKKISEKEKVILEIQGKIDVIRNLIGSCENRINILSEEEKDFPSNESITSVCKKLDFNRLETDVVLKDKSKKEDEILSLNNKIKELESTINKVKGYSKLPLNLASYDDAFGVISVINDSLVNVKVYLNDVSNKKKLLDSENSRLVDYNVNYDEIIFRVNSSKEELKVKNLEIETIRKVTNSKEFKELSDKLDVIEEIIATFNDKNSTYSKELGIIINEVAQNEVSMLSLDDNIRKSEIILGIFKDILLEEINLNYVKDVNVNDVKGILKRLENNSERDKSIATSNYYNGFNKYRQSLVDYNLVDSIIFDDRSALIKMYEEKGIDINTLNDIFSEASRQDITCMYLNKKVNLYSLLDGLKSDYESNQMYLNDRDNYLFHDILLKSIGTKIKDKINSASKWVSDINEIMKEKQKNSNLSFYLSWSSKSPESLEEMDTKELVEIFKMDPDSVNPKLTDKLIKHFKSKIAKREETMIDNGETYFDIIFSILDYRNWYQFKLFYKKDGKDRKELTNKAFSVFSGGERAKTMYIPLFASMSAKLWGARKDAPRLIALDEAFAGVDDKNIEEMFGILKSFDLDYILTSQALWCDYSEINDISICELIGDKVSNTIGVKRYRWNGKERVSLDE